MPAHILLPGDEPGREAEVVAGIASHGTFTQSSGTVEFNASNGTMPFNNTGILDVIAGSLDLMGGGNNTGSVIVSGNLTASSLSFSNPAFLQSSSAGTITLTGDLAGDTSDADLFNPQGTLQFSGGGTRQLEVMSKDIGNVTTGYVNNFAYGTIQLVSGTNLTLVNNSENVSSTEALYVNNLIVPTGSTLNLNGLNVYARATEINGTVTGGVINPVADGGAIALGQSYPGQILNNGEVDSWTFFGRAGRGVTISVNPGAATAPSPLPPPINWAAVDIVNPDGTILASADNTGTGSASILNLLGVVLPVDGTYTIRVHAPTSQASSTGRYVLTAWDATVNVNPLTLGQQATGTIATPFSVDRWTFSASANAQVQFNLINRSASSLAFTLTGPNGYTAFSDSTASSGLIVLPTDGQYTLTARSSTQTESGSYAFNLVQTTQTSLALGTPFSGTFTGSGQAQLFRINVPITEVLSLQLTGPSTADSNEVYLKFGAPPTRADYDYRFSSPSNDQNLFVPSAVAGTWYVLVYSNSLPAPSAFTLTATASILELTSVTPSKTTNNTPSTVTLTGAGFTPGTTVSLRSSNNVAFAPTSTTLDSFTKITAVFPANLPTGLYSVQVTAGANSALLSNAITFNVGAPDFEYKLVLPQQLGRHALG